MSFRSYLEQAKRDGVFIEHNAGDTTAFRYPQSIGCSGAFRYDAGLRCWRLIDAETGKCEGAPDSNIFRTLASEDITVYEFLAPSARRIHCLDMIGIPYDDDLRERAFCEVRSLYEEREGRFPEIEVVTLRAAELAMRDEFSYLRQLYCDVEQVPVHFAKFTGGVPWPFGSVLKGTDVVLSDWRPLNVGQDALHALYHLHEGIPGIGGDNCHVREIWAPVPALYALQLAEGRMSRRIRLRPSPHPIHFTDYIFLRAYLGQGFEGNTEGNAIAHPAYAVIEPAIRLMVSSLDHMNAWDRNRVLADAVLADKTDELVACFDERHGEGSFAAVFDTYALYDKRRRALEFVEESELDDIMFKGPALLPSCVPAETVERIWKDEELRADAFAVLGLLGLD